MKSKFFTPILGVISLIGVVIISGNAYSQAAPSASSYTVDLTRLDSVTLNDLELAASRYSGTVESHALYGGTSYVASATLSFPDESSAENYWLSNQNGGTSRACKDIISTPKEGHGCVIQCTAGSGKFTFTQNFSGVTKDLGGTGNIACLPQ
ncbi:MAG: hypothetical protein H7A32_00545 [Deltaproteobacteria bacterium]|nr:hypothetical protein [Deltaproteobacteria bacterium]